jgi:4-amino-4-deoxy-L-arabinose transferase-like glycosyltransferase
VRENTRTYFLPILAGALVLRLATVLTMLRRDPHMWFYNQTTELGRLGQSLVMGRGLSSPFGGNTGPSAFLAPGYPALVALIFRFFGSYSWHAAAVLLVLQVLFAVATVFIVMLVARMAFNACTANIAGAIWAFSPPLWWLPAVFWESGLSTTMLIASLAFALHCAARPKPWKWAAMGAFFAGAMLINPSLMLALFSVGTWAIYRARAGSRAVSALLLVATCTALFMAWPVRNEREMHAFIPMRSNFGYELWQGNRTGSDGKFSAELHPNVNAQEFTRYAALGEVDYMREKKAAIRAQPGRFVELTGKRFVQFWLGLGSHQTSALIVLHIVATTVLGLAGFVLLWRRRRGLALLFAGPMLFFPLPYYITHADFRFRLILDPLATVLCAYAVAQWMGRKQGAGSPRTNLGYRGTRE